MDWTSGYLAEIDYTWGYYRELAPGLIDFALLLAGYAPPGGEAIRYLELGAGQGLSANIHAAAVAGEFFGADFNPSHTANARLLAGEAGSGAHFVDDGFAEFAAREEISRFDYIVLHGVWSWISTENREVLVEIVRRRLKIGGVVYLSYNTLPGWAPTVPVRHLLTAHAERAGNATQGVAGRIAAALAFASKLAEAGGRYFTANPAAKVRIDAIAGQDKSYVAHEYFNRDWEPMFFSQVEALMAGAKLTYACPAGALDQFDGFNLTAPQQELLAAAAGDPILRESVRDFLVNQQFRRDLRTRGARRLGALERRERLEDVRVALTVGDEAFTFEVDAGLGKVGLRKEIYEPLVEELARDGGAPKRVGDLALRPSLAALPFGTLIEALAVLVGAGRAHPAQDPARIEAAAPACQRLNHHLMRRARQGGEIGWLASPVIGAGVAVGRFEQMFLDARARGLATPELWAKDAWETLSRQNQSLIKNGEVLATPEANLEELRSLGEALAGKRLGLLQRLGVA